jgi:maltose O-acetyltransferase
LPLHKHSLFCALANTPLLPWNIRRRIFGLLGLVSGDRTYIERNCHIASDSVSIGAGTYINHGFYAEGPSPITIGNDVRIGPFVRLITSTHEITDNPAKRASHTVHSRPIEIADGVWIGAGVTVLPGCTIATGCVVAAGAVVARSTEPNGIYAGVPARRLRDLQRSPEHEAPRNSSEPHHTAGAHSVGALPTPSHL